jgi:hypothetical protein
MSNWSSTIANTLAPVTSVNSQTGAVSLNAASIGAAATSHTHDASAITTGTVATARLGSGTANSTSYLRGDQTWATISAGDTVYTPAVTDAENTSALTSLVQFNVPGGTWANGEFIDIFISYRTVNVTGTSQTFTTGIYLSGDNNGITFTNALPTNSNRYGVGLIRLYRDNANMRFSPLNSNITYYEFLGPTLIEALSSGYTLDSWNSISPNFANTLSISVRGQWSAANPSLYWRVLNARAVKYGGQAT